MGIFSRFKKKPTPPTNPNYVQGHIAGTEYHTAEPNIDFDTGEVSKAAEPEKRVYHRKLYASGGGSSVSRRNLSISLADPLLADFSYCKYPAVFDMSTYRPHSFMVDLTHPSRAPIEEDVVIKDRKDKRYAINHSKVIHFRGKARELLADAPCVKVIVDYDNMTVTFIGVTEDRKELKD